MVFDSGVSDSNPSFLAGLVPIDDWSEGSHAHPLRKSFWLADIWLADNCDPQCVLLISETVESEASTINALPEMDNGPGPRPVGCNAAGQSDVA